jgi:hypothetical protein
MADLIGNESFTTTDTYVRVWKYVSNIRDVTSDLISIGIANTDEANGLLYRIVAAFIEGGTDDVDAAWQLKAETTLAADTKAPLETLTAPFREVAVYVKSAVAEAAASGTVSANGS